MCFESRPGARLHGSLDAPLIHKSLAVLDETMLLEALDEEAEELPSLWDFVDSEAFKRQLSESPREEDKELRFRRRLAKASELPLGW